MKALAAHCWECQRFAPSEVSDAGSAPLPDTLASSQIPLAWQESRKLVGHVQDFVVEQLRKIPGMVIPEPEGAFYALPEVTAFFGPDVEADGFGSIPDVDTLCRQASETHAPVLPHSAYMQVMYSITTCV